MKKQKIKIFTFFILLKIHLYSFQISSTVMTMLDSHTVKMCPLFWWKFCHTGAKQFEFEFVIGSLLENDQKLIIFDKIWVIYDTHFRFM